VTETDDGLMRLTMARFSPDQACNTRDMHPAIIGVGIVLVLAISGLIVHLTLTWMASRGWIWYRSIARPGPSSLGLIEGIYQPSMEHVIEEEARERTEADQAESGEEL
jgi:hypothetical protein